MPGHLIQLNPKLSPQDYYKTNKAKLGIVPDGTGLQILFDIDDEFYVLAGSRQGRLLSVNGGAIENKQLPFVNQLEEELNEETFGMLQLKSTENGYYLVLKDGSVHALSMQDEHTFLMHKTGKYAYVTFTATCNTLTLVQLTTLAQALSPTANFWNKIGNYLFQQTQSAPKDAKFTDYWNSLKDIRGDFIKNLENDYHQLIESGQQLLVDPMTVFNSADIEQSLNQLGNIADYDALVRMARHTVGRYSERSGYHVLRASELIRVAQTDCTDKNVKDITDQTVAMGIFNGEAVAEVFTALTINSSKISAAGVLQFGAFALTAPPSVSATQAADHRETPILN